MTLDILFRHGTIIDGSGAPAYRADLGVAGARIAVIGDLGDATAGRVVDAGGLCIVPGFVDPHSHAETGLLDGSAGAAVVQQGVTTHLLTADGFGYAPLSPARLAEMRAHLAPFHGEPALRWDWRSLSEYLALYAGRTPINVFGQASHHAIRLEALGWEARPATPAELTQMQALIHAAFDDGAVAFATGLDYYPGGHADTAELIALSRAAGRRGGLYTAHVRYPLGSVVAATREAIQIGREADIPIHLSHLYGDEALFELMEEAGAQGVDISFDSYPYTAGESQLLNFLPAWVQSGSPAEVMARLADPAARQRMRPAVLAGLRPPAEWDKYILTGVEAAGRQSLVGRTLAELMGADVERVADFFCDLLLESRLQVLVIETWLTEEMTRRSLTHPRQMVLSDGIYRGRPHPRAYGTHPRVLGHYVRELGLLTWEDAVRRMTGWPAERCGLRQRGQLRAGWAADIALFDPLRVGGPADFAAPTRPPVGIPYVLVNGEFVVDEGKRTPANPGRVLKPLISEE